MATKFTVLLDISRGLARVSESVSTLCTGSQADRCGQVNVETVPNDKGVPPDNASRVEREKDSAKSLSPISPSHKVADRPHPVTVRLGLISPAIAVVALLAAFLSLWTSQRAMKVSQRAYLTYQVTVTNPAQVVETLHTDKDFFLNYQVTITNMGNTPADSVYPKIRVAVDPDRTPIIMTFQTEESFDLGPKESRVLTGQALFKHLHNVRGLPGLSTGFKGPIEYEDVFGDSQVKQVCYQYRSIRRFS